MFRRSPKRQGLAPNTRLIVGLGNPGPNYVNTRHNAGFLIVDELAGRYEVAFRNERHYARAQVQAALTPGGEALTLIKPSTFMNLSGRAVQAALTKTRAPLESVLVIHDDIDLPLGRLRFKMGGGAGGQRGVRSIINTLGPDFPRLKVGVGRPPEGWATDRWVLSRFREGELELVARVLDAAADATELYLRDGLEEAMNVTNGLDLTATGS